MDLSEVEVGFIGAGVPAPAVKELLDAYVEAKRRFYLGDHRPHAVEGGRFSEAAFRVLQHLAGLHVTPLGKSLPNTDRLLTTLENVAGAADSVRLHIPRTLKVIYDIRNKRDVAHLADGIDPNLQDATIVVACMDWVLAEFVRLQHGVAPDRAQEIIEDLVTREVPVVQEIDGHPVILKDLQARDQALLMLYRAGAAGATLEDLADWLRVGRKDNLSTRLTKLDEQKLVFRHPKSGRIHITDKGNEYVQKTGILQAGQVR